MKIESVTGIVLTDTNYSESSKIMNILTKEHGLIGVISKGCRNIKSKLRAVSRKMIYGKFYIYYKEKGLSTLIQVDVINDFNNILKDLDSITYSSYILELTNQVVKESENENIFPILESSLIKINEGLNPLVITLSVELKYLNFLGVSPSLFECSVCGSKENILTLSVSSGGAICASCYRDGLIVKPVTLKLAKVLYMVDIDNISKINVKKENLKELNDFISEYYDKYTGIYLKSKKMMEKISSFVES